MVYSHFLQMRLDQSHQMNDHITGKLYSGEHAWHELKSSAAYLAFLPRQEHYDKTVKEILLFTQPSQTSLRNRL